MEKLILRSVMYGADKIPDSWFDKVPGGFYKSEKDNERGDRKKHVDDGHRRSDHHRRRRYSTGDSSRGQPSNMEGYRSESNRRRRDRRDRRSYDGGEDDQYSGDDRQRRRRHGADSRRRQSRHDDDRYGHRDGHDSPPREDFPHDRRASRRKSPPPDSDYADGVRKARNVDDAQFHPALPGNFATDDTARHQDGSLSNSQPPSVSPVYVPYAHLYGGPKPMTPPSTAGSIQPSAFTQVIPSVAPRKYHQNVDAQQAPTAAAAGAGAMYDGQPGWLYPEDPRWDPRYAGAHDEYRTAPGDDDSEDKYSSHPPSSSHQSTKGDYSPSDTSFSNHDKRSRRSDRDDSRSQRAKSHGGRGKSRIGEKFDSSQRGLGYSAVGALAGGLVGSEIGNGAVPIGLAVAVGALGANAFQARERYVNTNDEAKPRKPPLGAHASQHRGAAPSTSRPRKEEGKRMEPPPPRRKEGERHAQWIADGTYARRDAQRHDSGDRDGYHSD